MCFIGVGMFNVKVKYICMCRKIGIMCIYIYVDYIRSFKLCVVYDFCSNYVIYMYVFVIIFVCLVLRYVLWYRYELVLSLEFIDFCFLMLFCSLMFDWVWIFGNSSFFLG